MQIIMQLIIIINNKELLNHVLIKKTLKSKISAYTTPKEIRDISQKWDLSG